MDNSRITLYRRAFRSGSSEFWRGRLTGAAGFWRPVLVKRLAPELATDARLVEQERTEALLTAHLVHPNILTVLDYGLHDGQPATLHENVIAVDLLHLLERATTERRRIPSRLALHIARGVLAALSHSHRHIEERLGFVGIAHGDLSPTNILIDQSGHIRVRDFGIPLQPSPQGPIGRLGRLHGKPGYMSPELVTRGILGPRSDLFAVGILLYELTSFRRLFTGKDNTETLRKVALAQVEERLSRLAIEMPTAPVDALTRALQRQPDDRFASADEMLFALSAYGIEDVAADLAAFIAEVAPPIDEETPAPDGTIEVRPRSGRRAASRMILPNTPADDELAPESPHAVIIDEEDWLDATPPPLPQMPEVEVMLADIDPVGPPPLPGDTVPPPLPFEAPTRSLPRPK